MESEHYALRTGYADGPVPFNIGAMHSEEREIDPVRPTKTTESTLTFSARNVRNETRATTDLAYIYDELNRMDDGFNTQRGIRQSVNFLDTEKFGSGDWIRLNSLVTFNSLTESLAPNDTLLADESLQLEHTPALATSYDYGFTYSSSRQTDCYGNQGRAGVSYQLYDNLRSSFDLHGSTQNCDGPGSTLDTTTYGASLNEQYTRHLSDWGFLSAGYSGSYERNERTASGQTLTVVNEQHVLTDGIPVFLAQPLVQLSTVVVTDPTGTTLYQLGVDYELIARGPLTEIRRIAALTSQIPNGATVRIDYAATLQPSATYDTIANAANIRLDLWRNLFGLFARWSNIDYSGDSTLILRSIDTKTVGVDATWRWFHASAQYEYTDSNLTPVESWRLMQSAQWSPDEFVNLSLNANESWTTYRDTDTHDTTYTITARAQLQLAANLFWITEGGILIQDGPGFTQEIETARTSLDWFIGKLTLKLDYQYSTEKHNNDGAERHTFTLRARRTF